MAIEAGHVTYIHMLNVFLPPMRGKFHGFLRHKVYPFFLTFWYQWPAKLA